MSLGRSNATADLVPSKYLSANVDRNQNSKKENQIYDQTYHHKPDLSLIGRPASFICKWDFHYRRY